MSDLFIFMFGLVATTVTLGPLIIAAISELRENDFPQEEKPQQRP